MRTVHKLRNLTAAELRFRIAEKASVLNEAAHITVGNARWPTPLLLPAGSHSSTLSAASAALHRNDRTRAGAALAHHFAERQPHFALEPRDRRSTVSRIHGRFPSATREAVRRAGLVLSGKYDLLGYKELTFGNAEDVVDWHLDPVSGRRPPFKFWSRVPYLDPKVGDHKVIWELNRHQHWLTLGRAAWLSPSPDCSRRFKRELASWLRQNPPYLGVNWSSMLELGFRCLSWIWALNFFLEPNDDDSGWVVDLLGGLQLQLDHISRHLSRYFSPNTHLLGEGLALYIAGRVLPELRNAAHWEHLGREVLVREARAQVHADGGHAEQSFHYHLYALDFYLFALVVAQRSGDASAAVFENTALRMARFCRAMTDESGRLATTGDDDGGALFPICGRAPFDAGPTLSLAANLLQAPDLSIGTLREEVVWMMAGKDPGIEALASTPETGSILFPDTGYVSLRSPHGHAIVDAGRHGFLNGGHAHADALSLTLAVSGRPLLIDPGTATYVMDPELRDRFRATAMHNTVVVNGRSQSQPAGAFHWNTRTDATLNEWKPSASFDYLEAEHVGYHPLIHRRVVMRIEELWIVADFLNGPGQTRAEAHWHVDPAWAVRSTELPSTYIAEVAGERALIATTASQSKVFFGDEYGLGWSAPIYGQLVPSPTLRFTHSGALPFSLITVIAAPMAEPHATVERLLADNSDSCTVRITSEGDSYLASFAPGPDESEPQARLGRKVVFEGNSFYTDARASVLRLSRENAPLALHLIGGSSFDWTGPGSLSIRDVATDLHLDGAALRQLQR